MKPFQEIGALLGILHLSKLIFAHFLLFLPEGSSVFLQTEELHSLRPPFSHTISNLELKSDFRISVEARFVLESHCLEENYAVSITPWGPKGQTETHMR